MEGHEQKIMTELTLTSKNQDSGQTSLVGEEIKSVVDVIMTSGEAQDKGPPWWRSQRYILAYLLFAGMMNVFFQRINFSIAIICMVNHTAVSSLDHNIPCSSNYSNGDGAYNTSLTISKSLVDQVLNSSNETQHSKINGMLTFHDVENAAEDSHSVSPLKNSPKIHDQPDLLTEDTEFTMRSSSASEAAKNQSLDNIFKSLNSSGLSQREVTDSCITQHAAGETEKEDGPLIWDKETQGLLLGAIYWTYVCVQIPGNHIVRKVKKKTVVLYSMLVMSAMTLLMHVAALWSPWAVFAVKLVQGACTAFVIIAMYGMLGKWAPPNERASLISLAMSGQMLGNIIVFPLSALLCKYGFLGGWPSIFYVFGGLGFLWIIFFFFLTDEFPSTHQFITENEKNYIMSTLPQSTHKEKPSTPWVAIITSPPFWGIVCGQFSFTWGLLLILSTLPQYMLEVLKFNIKSNGVYTMLPYVALLITTQAAGGISDFVIKRKILTVLWTRKMCIIIANMVPAVALSALSFLDHTQAELAITFLIIGVAATGFGLPGFMVSPYDIAPQFATEMMTVSNTFATIPGVLTTYVVAAITKDQTREQWQIVYFLTAGVYVLGALGFCLLHRGVIQPWAMDKELVVLKEVSVNRNSDGKNVDEVEPMLKSF